MTPFLFVIFLIYQTSRGVFDPLNHVFSGYKKI